MLSFAFVTPLKPCDLIQFPPYEYTKSLTATAKMIKFGKMEFRRHLPIRRPRART
jgi:hypothetical protein